MSDKVTSFIPDAIREAANTIAAAIQGGSGGSNVEWSQIVTTGTKIATITINEESTDVYAPTGGGGGSTVSWNEIQTTGTKIAEITIDGTTYDVYAPNVSVSASDVSYDNTASGLIADDAQEAIDELATACIDLNNDLGTLSGTVSGHTTDIGNLQTAVGSKASQSMIAPVETSTTSSQAYAIGEQFILNGTLYTATAAITAGGTIVIDGNCTASDTLTEQIHEEQFNVTGAAVSLLGYTTLSDAYKFPYDGYCAINATSAGAYARLRLADAKGINMAILKASNESTDGRNSVFVRKGMQAYVDQQNGTLSVYYYPLISYAE